MRPALLSTARSNSLGRLHAAPARPNAVVWACSLALLALVVVEVTLAAPLLLHSRWGRWASGAGDAQQQGAAAHQQARPLDWHRTRA